jgi:hypothetical protein
MKLKELLKEYIIDIIDIMETRDYRAPDSEWAPSKDEDDAI